MEERKKPNARIHELFKNFVSEGFSKGLFDGLLEEGMVEDFGKTECWTVTVVNVKHVHTKHMNLWVSYFS